MTETMIVGVDGSDPGKRAAEFAANVAAAHQAKLLVIYVIEWSPYTFNTPEENEQRHARREREIDAARSGVLDPLVRELSSANAEVEGLVYHGHPAKILNTIAKQKSASQLFIGRTGGSAFSKMLFGSVAGNLVQTASVPVTVIP